jgi:hypothetical protein
MSLMPGYFERKWPLFGCRSSLVGTGLAEAFVGIHLLGTHNEAFASEEKMGYSIHSLMIGSGAVVLLMGIFGIVAVSLPVHQFRQPLRQRQSLVDDPRSPSYSKTNTAAPLPG